MYRSDLEARDKGGAIAAVIAIHAGLLMALLQLSGKVDLTAPETAMKILDLTVPPPPPPPKQNKVQQPKPKQKEGGSAPKNIKREATEIKVPKPRVVVPPRPQIAATDTPRHGTAPTQGAAPERGPGTGAGGTGNGTGNGAGSGSGGGGADSRVAEPPHLMTPVLRGQDFPRGMIERWPGRATVFLRLRVDARGYVGECTVDRGTGVGSIDAAMCNVAHDRLRFRPALNRSGQAIPGWFGYAQPAPR